MREVDTIARLGGDEFAVLLEGVGPPESAALVERLTVAVARPVALASATVAVRASVGVATADGDPYDLATLLHDADLAMYAAKETAKRVETAKRTPTAATRR